MKNPIQEALASLIDQRVVLPGDAVLYRYGPAWRHPIAGIIRRVQKRVIADLPKPPPPALVGDPATPPYMFTHAGLVLDRAATVEMTNPKARIAKWETALGGIVEIAIVRPRSWMQTVCPPKYRAVLCKATAEAKQDVLDGRKYPLRELGVYWLWSWAWCKLYLDEKFAKVFTSKDNVCSGSVIDWWKRAGVWESADEAMTLQGSDLLPESWYPGRFLVDHRFQVVHRINMETKP